MSEKVTLTRVYRDDTERTGASGKPYKKMSIKTSLHADRWISGFQNSSTKDWKEGDTVELTIKQSEKLDKEGRPYLNFDVPRAEFATKAEVQALADRLEIIEFTMASSPSKPVTTTPERDLPNPDDIPF